MGGISAKSGRRRARRSVVEGEAFRQHLIATAKALFLEEGYQAVSIRKITERADCPTMTFYVYFRNKRELLRHIWDDVLMAAADQADAAASKHDDVENAIEAYLGAWLGYWLDNPDNYRLVFLYQDKLSDTEDRYYVDTSDVQARFVTMGLLVARGIEEGRFAPIDPELATQALLVTALGVAHGLVIIPEYHWVDGVAPQALRQAIRGLRGDRG